MLHILIFFLLVKFVFLKLNSLFSNTSVVVCLFPSSLICYQVTSHNRLLGARPGYFFLNEQIIKRTDILKTVPDRHTVTINFR